LSSRGISGLVHRGLRVLDLRLNELSGLLSVLSGLLNVLGSRLLNVLSGLLNILYGLYGLDNLLLNGGSYGLNGSL